MSITKPRPTRRLLLLTAAVLEEAGTFFEACGVHGCEGTALIAGTVSENSTLRGDTLVIPDQASTAAPHVSVTVTPTGDLELLTALRPEQRYLARIHSHPGLAFHSRTDDNNPALTHQSAISIVAPFFGLGLRHGLDACAVYVREKGRWRELPAGGPERETWVKVSE
ncbi:Mov34/MPN/PAD-1 family protein [Kribbella speibonae]|uniref:Uncharacterized protein n=1 Tax=Kribbella speibonae TaxID=1572660 RepID=A0A4R0IWQ6_9ACTN|nr:Mov34/MPN/PAD-1 family protein [Kribbella speibonae]TCC33225.1 hypothetical protein E0H92_34335 [Kribbella speibonae]